MPESEQPASADGTRRALSPMIRPGAKRRIPLPGLISLITLLVIILACLGSLPFTLSSAGSGGQPRYAEGDLSNILQAPSWIPADEQEEGAPGTDRPFTISGTDRLGRSMDMRLLAGGGVSIVIGLAAALISVTIGTLYGSIAGWNGGRVDAVMMRFVDILYGLPYILLVVLLAVAGDALLAQTDLSDSAKAFLDIAILLVAIGGVSWLTMARVIRGQVLSLRNRPFIESARAAGLPTRRIFARHLLPNLMGPILVYATLTVPQAILQESFLSFLGIGVQPPMPSWGLLASDGLTELNPVSFRWWLILAPCLLLATTLVCLNFLGEALREAFDPRSIRQ
ncbi:MAG: ABC transporter permease [Planctomycetota bacterium]